MVKKIIKDKEELFYCEDCSLLYNEKDWAEKCEEWCVKNHSCNVDITNHSLKKVYNG